MSEKKYSEHLKMYDDRMEYLNTFKNSVDYLQVYDDIISKEKCKSLIKHHGILKKNGYGHHGRTTSSKPGIKTSYNVNKKSSYDIYLKPYFTTDNIFDEEFRVLLKKSYNNIVYFISDYLVKVGFMGIDYIGKGFVQYISDLHQKGERINRVGEEFTVNELCLRKYPRYTGGYHQMHWDSVGPSCPRVCAGILYLNTIREGGETFFPVLGKKIKPKRGRLVIFPSYFTHMHLGLPSLTNDRYIIAIHVCMNDLNQKKGEVDGKSDKNGK